MLGVCHVCCMMNYMDEKNFLGHAGELIEQEQKWKTRIKKVKEEGKEKRWK